MTMTNSTHQINGQAFQPHETEYRTLEALNVREKLRFDALPSKANGDLEGAIWQLEMIETGLMQTWRHAHIPT